jgi:hypothetical protein
MTTDRIHDSPYKGLAPFMEEDAQFFFGRERECSAVTYSLLGSKLTILYGATGSGKSSLLRAGVAHRLREYSRQNLLSRGTPEFIAVVFNTWSAPPCPRSLKRLNILSAMS